MKIPYHLDLTGTDAIVRHVTGDFPWWHSYVLPYANRRVCYEIPQMGSIFSQQLNFRPFFMELLEVRADRGFAIPFYISHRQIFLFFMLRGDIFFSTGEGINIAHVRGRHFLMSYYDTGKYLANCKKGFNIALIISILPEWLQSIGSHYAHIGKIMERYHMDNAKVRAMHQDRIGRALYRNINKVFGRMANIPKGRLDAFLRTHVTLFLEEYDRLLQNRPAIEQVMEYLTYHYTESAISVGFLCQQFLMDERTLFRQFSNSYGTAPMTYCNMLRVQRLQELMSEGRSIKESYHLVGYRSYSTCRYQYRLFIAGTKARKNPL